MISQCLLIFFVHHVFSVLMSFWWIWSSLNGRISDKNVKRFTFFWLNWFKCACQLRIIIFGNFPDSCSKFANEATSWRRNKGNYKGEIVLIVLFSHFFYIFIFFTNISLALLLSGQLTYNCFHSHCRAATGTPSINSTVTQLIISLVSHSSYLVFFYFIPNIIPFPCCSWNGCSSSAGCRHSYLSWCFTILVDSLFDLNSGVHFFLFTMSHSFP